jgi:hypothetical protein
MRRIQADVIILGRDNSLQLIVEAKNRLNTPAQWAIEYRRNLFKYDAIEDSPFFMVAFPDKIFLWKNSRHTNPLAHPDYEVDATKMLSAYVGGDTERLHRLANPIFKFLVDAWLGGVISFGIENREDRADYDWMVESGLYEAIRDGEIEYEAAA